MPASKKPRITVIVAVLNGASTIRRCLDSVAGQTYVNKELIVVDGGSSDGTLDILRQMSGQISHWQSGPDKGIYSAWNKGLEQATGEWICFLGADDYFFAKHVLERLSSHLIEAYPPIRVVYGRIHIVSPEGSFLSEIGIPWDRAKRWFPYFMNIPHPGLMHHRSLFETHGRFDESFKIAGDYEMLQRELINGDALFITDFITVGMQSGGVSHAGRSLSAIRHEFKRIRNKHQLNQLDWRRLWVDSKIMARITIDKFLRWLRFDGNQV